VFAGAPTQLQDVQVDEVRAGENAWAGPYEGRNERFKERADGMAGTV